MVMSSPFRDITNVQNQHAYLGISTPPNSSPIKAPSISPRYSQLDEENELHTPLKKRRLNFHEDEESCEESYLKKRREQRRVELYGDGEETSSNQVVNYYQMNTSTAYRRLFQSLGGKYSRIAQKSRHLHSHFSSKMLVSTPQQSLHMSEVTDRSTAFSLAYDSKNNVTLTGLEGGQIVRNRMGQKHSLLELDHLINSAVVDIDVHDDKYCFVSGSRLVVTSSDGYWKSLAFYGGLGAGTMKRARFNPKHNNMIATAHRGGDIGLIDLRVACGEAATACNNAEPHYGTIEGYDFTANLKPSNPKFFKKAHDVVNQPGRANRKDVAVTSLAWVSENHFVTGGEADVSLKLWDIRMRHKGKKAALLASTPALPERTGVCSVAYDRTSNKIWSLALDSVVRSYDLAAFESKPIDELSHSRLDVRNFFPQLAIMENSSFSGDAYIGVGGASEGFIVFPRPWGRQLPGKPVHLVGHIAQVSSICASDSAFYTVCEDNCLREWTFNPKLYESLANDNFNFDSVDSVVGWSGRSLRYTDI